MQRPFRLCDRTWSCETHQYDVGITNRGYQGVKTLFSCRDGRGGQSVKARHYYQYFPRQVGASRRRCGTDPNTREFRTLVREKLDAEVLLTGKEDKNVLDFRLPPRNAEEISQGIILTGLNIYSALMEHKGHLIEESFRFAFQAHCLLLAHRHHFGKQYTKICGEYEETALKEIEAILATLGLNVENAEIIAMMNYLNRER